MHGKGRQSQVSGKLFITRSWKARNTVAGHTRDESKIKLNETRLKIARKLVNHEVCAFPAEGRKCNGVIYVARGVARRKRNSSSITSPQTDGLMKRLGLRQLEAV